MSTIKAAQLTTENGTINLTMNTGNSSGPQMIVYADGNGLVISSNSTNSRIVSNNTGTYLPSNVSITGTASISGNATLQAIIANSSLGTAGQYLTTNATGIYWSTISIPAAPSAATQAEQEDASSTTTYVSPGRQHFHPSAAKFWAHFGVTGNLLAGYNTTSITDNGPGVATVVIATDFGTADYCVGVSIENLDATIDAVADGQMAMISNNLQLAGSVQVLCKNDDGIAAADPATWNVWGFGDLA